MGFKRRAFTLVEMLVVISIIALLVAMLLPALSNARKQAQAIVCSSNQRQMGTAYNTYAADGQDLLLWVYTGPGFPALTEDFSAEYNLIKSGYVLATKDATNLYSSPALLCPAGLTSTPSLFQYVDAAPATFRNGTQGPILIDSTPCQRRGDAGFTAARGWGVLTHYCVNGQYPGWENTSTPVLYPFNSQGLSAPVQTTQTRLTQIKHADDTWMMSEARSMDFGTTDVVWRHPGTCANFLYCDGHVKLLKPIDVDGSLWGGFPPWSVFVADQRLYVR